MTVVHSYLYFVVHTQRRCRNSTQKTQNFLSYDLSLLQRYI